MPRGARVSVVGRDADRRGAARRLCVHLPGAARLRRGGWCSGDHGQGNLCVCGARRAVRAAGHHAACVHPRAAAPRALHPPRGVCARDALLLGAARPRPAHHGRGPAAQARRARVQDVPHVRQRRRRDVRVEFVVEPHELVGRVLARAGPRRGPDRPGGVGHVARRDGRRDGRHDRGRLDSFKTMRRQNGYLSDLFEDDNIKIRNIDCLSNGDL